MSGVSGAPAAMLEMSDIGRLREWRRAARRDGRRVGLVPTMGALHEGHLSLVDEARRRSDLVVMSIFVNPLQFGPNEDYQRYPRDLGRDRALAQARGVALLFTPSVETMYPAASETRVVPGQTAARWEGEQRPGHFTGVLTAVLKLLNLVEPDVAVFGQKDIQQAVLIRRMVRDLDVPVELVVARTVREPDGLALSSRNAYLSPQQRQDALALYRSLRSADAAWRAGTRDAAALHAVIEREFGVSPGVKPDYIAVADPETLEPVSVAESGTIIAVAGRVGTTRLLDNHILGTEFRWS